MHGHWYSKFKEIIHRYWILFRPTIKISISGIRLSDNQPFSRNNNFKARQLRKAEHQLAIKGVRMFPHPFYSAFSLVSDCDKSGRDDYVAYKTQLVDILGLDFGDSCRLQDRTYGGTDTDGLCFYNCDGKGPPAADEDKDLNEVLGFLEMLREVHLGNIDHYHFYSGSGPRIFYLSSVMQIDNNYWQVNFDDGFENKSYRQKRLKGNFNFRGDYLPILAIAVVPSAGTIPDGTEITIRQDNGNLLKYDRHYFNDIWHPRFSYSDVEAGYYRLDTVNGIHLPLAKSVKHIDIKLPENNEQCVISGVFLINSDRLQILSMLDNIYNHYNFRTNIFTDHGSRYLVDSRAEARHSRENYKRVFEKPVAALSSSVKEKDLYYSSMGDDPDSFAYTLPELKNDFNVRMVNPGGSTSEVGSTFDILNAVVPARTRDGSLMYVARRMAPELLDNNGNRHQLYNDMGTRTLPLRISTILRGKSEIKHPVYPMYTHLGNLMPKSDRTDPYYPWDVLHELQNRVFNINGSITGPDRIWFTRASELYDYSLILRSIGPHIERADDNRIIIRSWRDHVLDKKLPVSANQLHGLTFYVKDRNKARVFLDDYELLDLTRNTRDETGKESVTVIGSSIRHIIFDDIDFISNSVNRNNSESSGINFKWIDNAEDACRGTAYARFSLVQ